MYYSSKKEQIKIYFGKRMRSFLYEKRWMSIIATAIIAFIIVFVTGDGLFADQSDTKRGAFTLICACIWSGLFNSIQNICKEREIIKSMLINKIDYDVICKVSGKSMSEIKKIEESLKEK